MRYFSRVSTLALILSLALFVWGPMIGGEASTGHLPASWIAPVLRMVNWYESIPITLPLPQFPA